MTKICTLLELSLVVKKSYCDLELKSSQQYFNTITARRFTAFHKPLAHRIHCWSFPRLQRQWQVFLLPLIHCKEYQTIVLFFRSDHFIDSTTPPPYLLFVVGCDSWEHVTWYPFWAYQRKYEISVALQILWCAVDMRARGLDWCDF